MKKTCDGCGHPSGKPAEYDLTLCSACKPVIEEGGKDYDMLMIKTFGTTELKFVKAIAKGTR